VHNLLGGQTLAAGQLANGSCVRNLASCCVGPLASERAGEWKEVAPTLFYLAPVWQLAGAPHTDLVGRLAAGRNVIALPNELRPMSSMGCH